MIASSRFPRGRRGVIVAVTALAVIAVAAVSGLIVRERGRSGQQVSGPVYPVPASQVVAPSTTATTAPQPDPTATCAPRESPLRRDAEFTPDDGTARTVRYSISLPDDYDTGCRQYPVLYALHGKGQNNVDFMNEALGLRRAMSAGVLEQAIIVTPNGYLTGRWENRETGPAEDDVIKQLIPYVERTYRVRPGAPHRLLVGFSMGGHGALRFGLKYPQTFAAVWSVDGAMADTASYLPLVDGRSTDDFRIIAIGGQLNGDRVLGVVDALKAEGIVIPYIYQDVRHTFTDFVAQDEKGGWQAMTYLQQNLGRTMGTTTSTPSP